MCLCVSVVFSFLLLSMHILLWIIGILVLQGVGGSEVTVDNLCTTVTDASLGSHCLYCLQPL